MTARSVVHHLLAGLLAFIVVGGSILIAAAAMDRHRHWFVSLLALYLLFEIGVCLGRLADRGR